MHFSKRSQWYHAVRSSGEESEVQRDADAKQHQLRVLPSLHWLVVTAGCVASLLMIVLVWTNLASSSNADIDFGERIKGCPTRHEWRTLSKSAQQRYISAVQCLRNLNSTISSDPTIKLFDDFPWIHSHFGYYVHNSAAFLPWHRYFLHVYETNLRERCGYDGSLVYWDWTKDSIALEHSPVFDSTTGFGGDGDVGANITLGRSGRCVVDGPFANLTVKYYDIDYKPHCLSRGFRSSAGKLGHIDGHSVSQASILEVLSKATYEEFVKVLEDRVHNAIPMGIGGDFETFTAPYDPLFYLHHVQLDRVWWLWQQRQPVKGLTSYGGPKARHSAEAASLNDDLYYYTLAPEARVKDVMNVKNELLCYEY